MWKNEITAEKVGAAAQGDGRDGHQKPDKNDSGQIFSNLYG